MAHGAVYKPKLMCVWSDGAAAGKQRLGCMARQVVWLVWCDCGHNKVGGLTIVRTCKCALGTKVGFCGFIQIDI